MTTYDIHPLDSDRWEDLIELFGPSGAFWGCWCMYWRYSNKVFNEATKEQKIADLKLIVDEKPFPPGLLAYLENKPVGWMGMSPKDSFERLTRSRVIKSPDDRPVWSIVCFFIHTKFRNRGVATSLVKGSIQFAKNRKIRIIEAYPVDNRGEQLEPISSYYGTLAMFEKAGFQLVGETKATSKGLPRVVVRYFNDL